MFIFKSIIVVVFFLLIVLSIVLVVCIRDVLVEWNCLFLFCVDDNCLFDLRYGINWFKVICLYILDKIGNSDIGWLFFGFLWFFCLNIGVIFVVF